MSHQIAADRDATFAIAKRLEEIAQKFSLPPPLVTSLVLLSWVDAAGPRAMPAAALIDGQIHKAVAAGPLPQYYFGLAGEVYLAAGRAADGLAILDRGVAALTEPGVGFYLPEIHRLRGHCLLALDRNAKAAARRCFEVARDIAERQGAVIFRQRAESALADL
jgi:hypothetical protein